MKSTITDYGEWIEELYEPDDAPGVKPGNGFDPAAFAEPSMAPVDLWGKFTPPELPRGLLPPVIEQFAFAQGDVMGADPAGLAMAALAVCAAILPDRIKLKVKRHGGWTEAARLWVGLVGEPSTKKTEREFSADSPRNCILDFLRQGRVRKGHELTVLISGDVA
jgi:hypothetical protein